MSRAVVAWLALCGSLVAPRLARGEGTGTGGDRGVAVVRELSQSRSRSARGTGEARPAGGSQLDASVWACFFVFMKKTQQLIFTF